MRISYTPSFKDFQAFNFYVLGTRFRALLLISGISLVLFLMSPWISPAPKTGASVVERYVANAGFLIVPAMAAFLAFAIHRAARRRWDGAAEMREMREYVIDEAGIHVQSPSIETHHDWSAMKKADFTQSYVYLMTGQRHYYFFPVQSVPDLAAMKALVGSKMRVNK